MHGCPCPTRVTWSTQGQRAARQSSRAASPLGGGHRQRGAAALCGCDSGGAVGAAAHGLAQGHLCSAHQCRASQGRRLLVLASVVVPTTPHLLLVVVVISIVSFHMPYMWPPGLACGRPRATGPHKGPPRGRLPLRAGRVGGGRYADDASGLGGQPEPVPAKQPPHGCGGCCLGGWCLRDNRQACPHMTDAPLLQVWRVRRPWTMTKGPAVRGRPPCWPRKVLLGRRGRRCREGGTGCRWGTPRRHLPSVRTTGEIACACQCWLIACIRITKHKHQHRWRW